ncbi:unnamed protein product [Amoebophrya sp. A120]|nr:unnamed protein product [Amoebophrya sp. A120]|eukprot:GSA120T00008814001.1
MKLIAQPEFSELIQHYQATILNSANLTSNSGRISRPFSPDPRVFSSQHQQLASAARTLSGETTNTAISSSPSPTLPQGGGGSGNNLLVPPHLHQPVPYQPGAVVGPLQNSGGAAQLGIVNQVQFSNTAVTVSPNGDQMQSPVADMLADHEQMQLLKQLDALQVEKHHAQAMHFESEDRVRELEENLENCLSRMYRAEEEAKRMRKEVQVARNQAASSSAALHNYAASSTSASAQPSPVEQIQNDSNTTSKEMQRLADKMERLLKENEQLRANLRAKEDLHDARRHELQLLDHIDRRLFPEQAKTPGGESTTTSGAPGLSTSAQLVPGGNGASKSGLHVGTGSTSLETTIGGTGASYKGTSTTAKQGEFSTTSVQRPPEGQAAAPRGSISSKSGVEQPASIGGSSLPSSVVPSPLEPLQPPSNNPGAASLQQQGPPATTATDYMAVAYNNSHSTPPERVKRQKRLVTPDKELTCFTCSVTEQDAFFVIGTDSGHVLLLDAESAKLLATLDVNAVVQEQRIRSDDPGVVDSPAKISYATFSPDRSLLAVALETSGENELSAPTAALVVLFEFREPEENIFEFPFLCSYKLTPEPSHDEVVELKFLAEQHNVSANAATTPGIGIAHNGTSRSSWLLLAVQTRERGGMGGNKPLGRSTTTFLQINNREETSGGKTIPIIAQVAMKVLLQQKGAGQGQIETDEDESYGFTACDAAHDFVPGTTPDSTSSASPSYFCLGTKKGDLLLASERNIERRGGAPAEETTLLQNPAVYRSVFGAGEGVQQASVEAIRLFNNSSPHLGHTSSSGSGSPANALRTNSRLQETLFIAVSDGREKLRLLRASVAVQHHVSAVPAATSGSSGSTYGVTAAFQVLWEWSSQQRLRGPALTPPRCSSLLAFSSCGQFLVFLASSESSSVVVGEREPQAEETTGTKLASIGNILYTMEVSSGLKLVTQVPDVEAPVGLDWNLSVMVSCQDKGLLRLWDRKEG